MTFCIISHVLHTKKDHSFYAYSPYVNEMNIWLRFVDKVIVVAPLAPYTLNAIHAAYHHGNIEFREAKPFNLLSVTAIFHSLIALPSNSWRIYKAMKSSDHIHLRCPGNMGVLGCLIQMAFPKKKKSAKYAGNWDPKSRQPLSYRFQKWILNNTFLTRNMTVLAYGEWEGQTKNILPFFTATYHEKEKIHVVPRTLQNTLHFIFAGALTQGKQPLYAMQLVQRLNENGQDVKLSLFGDGKERTVLQDYIRENNLEGTISLKGNSSREELKTLYQNSHFLILPSKSEGWPKVVAEAMFWGCVPVAAKVSCIPEMLDFGKRGMLLSGDLIQDTTQLKELCNDPDSYHAKATAAMEWSRRYTLDVFEDGIKKIMGT